MKMASTTIKAIVNHIAYLNFFNKYITSQVICDSWHHTWKLDLKWQHFLKDSLLVSKTGEQHLILQFLSKSTCHFHLPKVKKEFTNVWGSRQFENSLKGEKSLFENENWILTIRNSTLFIWRESVTYTNIPPIFFKCDHFGCHWI